MMVEKKKHLPICRKVVTSNDGDTIEIWEMENKLVHSYMWMSVLKD